MRVFSSGAASGKSAVAIFILAVFTCLLPFQSSYAQTERFLCKSKDCKVTPDPAAATGKENVQLLNFAQTSDIHIVDEGNPLRLEEIQIKNAKNPDALNEILKNISSANRPIGPYSALLWEYVIEDLNAFNALDKRDFMIATGDYSDTSITPEYRLFSEIVDGKIPTPLDKHCEECKGNPDPECICTDATQIPENPQGLDAKFYATTGNHDLEYMGSFNTDGFIGLLVKELAMGVELDDLCYLEDIIGIYQASDKASHFAFDMDEENSLTGKIKGAYTFDPSPFIHCIVLNTCEFYKDKDGKETPVENFSLGVMSLEQRAWLLNDVDANSNKLCLIFSHHGPHSFWPLLSKNSKYFTTSSAVKEALKKKKNVIAWLNGHTHMNKIRAEYNDDGTGYWDINTSGIIDFPYEWRNIKIFDMGNGLGMIRTQMNYPSNIDRNKVKFMDEEGDKLGLHEGTANDRDVELYFRMPVEVAQAIIGEKPQPVIPQDDTSGESTSQTADSSDSGSSSTCFISSALL